MTPDDLDPSAVFAFLLFLAAFAAGQELSQMTVKRKRPKYTYDAKVAGAIFVIIIAAVLLMYAFGSPAP